MKIEHLWYLKEIAESKSISAAGRRLYIGQTTLSAVVKSVEDEFNIQLFERTATGIQTTAVGELFLAQANEIISRYEKMLQDFSNNSLRREVHFLGDSSCLNIFASYVCNLIQKNYPDAKTVLHETSRQKIAYEIADGIAKVGITHLDTAYEIKKTEEFANRNGLVLKYLSRDRFYLCCRADSERFAHRESVNFEELKEEKYVAPQYYSTVPNQTLSGGAFRTLNCVAIMPTIDHVKQFIADRKEGDVFTLLSNMSLMNDPRILHREIVAIPLTNVPYVEDLAVYLISRKRTELTEKERMIYDSLILYGKEAVKNSDDGETYISTLIP